VKGWSVRAHYYGGVDNYVYDDPTKPETTDPTIRNDQDFINEGVLNCCPDGFICCGRELGCIDEIHAPTLVCPAPPTDGTKPCCAQKTP
jgi:hypothetical protein